MSPEELRVERVKLFATLLNTMAGSSFTLGVIAPIAAAFFYQTPNLPVLKVLLGSVIWTTVVMLLHLFAQAMLGSLRQ